ncbi:MAG: hypothetical protein EHM46_06820, partial [Bacteroidetes bacterium]
MAIADNGRIYIGGYEEFGYYLRDETGRLVYHSLSISLDRELFHNDEIWRIIPRGNGAYFQSFSSIFLYDGDILTRVELPGNVVLLMQAGDRLLVHVVSSGLHELVDDRLIPLEGKEMLAGDEIKMALPISDGRLLIGAARTGLYIYDDHSFIPFEIPGAELIRQSGINNGIISGGNLVIGTIVNGVFIMDAEGNLQNHLHAGNALQNNTVLSLSGDDSGNIWIGLDKGIDCIVKRENLDYYLDREDDLGTIFDAAIYSGSLWLGTNLGLFRMQTSGYGGFERPQMIRGSQGQVWDLALQDGELLVGHTNGTYQIVDGRMAEITDINGGFDLEPVLVQGEKILVQGTYSNLCKYSLQEGGWRFSGILRGLMEPLVQLESDLQGNLWAAHLHRNVFRISTDPGLDSVSRILVLGTGDGFPSDRNLRLARVGNRVVFPTGTGIYTYDDLNDTVIPYSQLNDALGSFSLSTRIIPGRSDMYWFIRDQAIGLFRINDRE